MTRPAILAVLAHPDDESFVAGGALCRYASQGCFTALLTVTDGQAGRAGLVGETPLVDRDGLGAFRREELRRAAAVLGIGNLRMPGWADGGLDQVPDARGVRLVVDAIRELRPAVLLTFGLEGGGSGHRDHAAVGRWTTEAFERAADAGYRSEHPPHAPAKLYWITWPRILDSFRGISGEPITAAIDLAAEVEARKRRAFAEHASQQDFRSLYDDMLAKFESREYFHLARSRVPVTGGTETDLLAGLHRGGS